VPRSADTQAVYQRAGVGYQLTADMQRQYVSTRYSITQQSSAARSCCHGDVFRFLASLFDPELAQQSALYP